MSKITKQDLIDEAKELISKLKKESSESSKKILTRNFYRLNSKYGNQYEQYYNTFEEFKDELMDKKEIKEYELERKVVLLQKQNKELLDDKQNLLLKSINEEKILDVLFNKTVSLKIPEKLKLHSVSKKGSISEAILMISDVHVPEVIISDHVNNINEYNWEICKKRLNRVFYYFVHYCQKFDIKKATIVFLGDLFSGVHHDELKRTNEFDEVTALFNLNEYLSEKLLEIESYFNELNCEFVVGNHSRIPEGKPQWKLSGILNYEYILAKHLKMQFDLIQKQQKIKKININVHSSLFKIIEVAGRRFFLTHGHMLSQGSNSFAGIPYYGLSMSGGKIHGYLTSQDNVAKDDFSDVLMGHLHVSSRVKIPSGNLYINGSVIGTGEYGLFKMKAISEAEQTMLIVQKGKVIDEMILRGNEY